MPKTKPKPEPLTADAQAAAKLSEIRAANAECKRLQLIAGEAKENAKHTKAVYEDSVDVLHRLIDDNQGNLFPLGEGDEDEV